MYYFSMHVSYFYDYKRNIDLGMISKARAARDMFHKACYALPRPSREPNTL